MTERYARNAAFWALFTVLMFLAWVLLTGCGGGASTFTEGDSSDDSPEAIWDAPDAVEDSGEPEVPDDPLEDPDAVEEPPCGGPDDDCDEDGWTPGTGDCCDDHPGVHPGAGWASSPYECPGSGEGPSWDWDCSGEVEVSVEDVGDGLEELLPDSGCDGVSGSLQCNAAEGWVPEPECGVTAEYFHCFWYSTTTFSGCYPHPATWEGVVECR